VVQGPSRRTNGANFIGDRNGPECADEDGGPEFAALRPVHACTCRATEPIRSSGEHGAAHRPRGVDPATEHTYGLMMHMSDGLGVNCTYCHNTRNFKTWEGRRRSAPPPGTASAWRAT
jgi:photosynthetic reaction center cytochrome c subunit